MIFIFLFTKKDYPSTYAVYFNYTKHIIIISYCFEPAVQNGQLSNKQKGIKSAIGTIFSWNSKGPFDYVLILQLFNSKGVAKYI